MPQIEMLLRSERLPIGSLTYHICENLTAIELHHHDISETMGGYLHDLGLRGDYPMAFLEQIVVDENLRKMGYGSKLLRKFERKAAEESCKMALCRVGWFGGAHSRESNINFYRKNIWKIWNPSEDLLVMAFKPLSSCEPCDANEFSEINFRHGRIPESFHPIPQH